MGAAQAAHLPSLALYRLDPLGRSSLSISLLRRALWIIFGIAELMKEAGLTVGGFYKHFDSGDELVAEGLSDGFGTWQRQKEAAASSRQSLCFEKLIP
jgi:hypothetical protein